MAELEYSQFDEDLLGIIEGITADIKTAIGAIENVFVDRYPIEVQLPNYAVIIPTSITIRGNEDGVASIPQVEQEFSFTIFIKRKIGAGDNVIAVKAQETSRLTGVLMASIRYKSIWERPFVGSVDLSEAEPNPSFWVASIDFVVRCANWRHAAIT